MNPERIDGYRPFHALDCPARTAWAISVCDCGGLDKPLHETSATPTEEAL